MMDFIKILFDHSSPKMEQLLSTNVVVLDVRTKVEFDAGHIQGARHTPLDRIKAQIDQIRRLNKQVITVCRSGVRSAAAKDLLSRAGIEAYDGGPRLSLKNKYSLK